MLYIFNDKLKVKIESTFCRERRNGGEREGECDYEIQYFAVVREVVPCWRTVIYIYTYIHTLWKINKTHTLCRFITTPALVSTQSHRLIYSSLYMYNIYVCMCTNDELKRKRLFSLIIVSNFGTFHRGCIVMKHSAWCINSVLHYSCVYVSGHVEINMLERCRSRLRKDYFFVLI